MNFEDIAKYLRITESRVKQLCKKKIIPGEPLNNEWDVTEDEIDSWYNKLTGEEWAKLVSAGKMHPIFVEIHLEFKVLKKHFKLY